MARWLDEGTEDRRRLEPLIPLADQDGRLRLSRCLTTLFPGDLPSFTAFRGRVNAKGKQLGLCLEVDSFKKSPPEKRFCWFTGPDRAAEQAEAFSRQATHTAEQVNFISPRGVDPTKRRVRLFVSYKSEEADLVDALLAELKKHFDCSPDFEMNYWRDRDSILVGRHFTRTFGVPGYNQARIVPEKEPEGRDALEELTRRTCDPAAFPMFALLGEYGIGKTTTLRKFTRDPTERRRHDPAAPAPILH